MFLEDTLMEVGFTQTLLMLSSIVSLLLKCRSYGMVNLNSDSFTPSLGLKQGDPLSSYLFLLCIERQAHGIQEKIQDRTWRPIRLSREGPGLSHLFFVDDLIMFGEASNRQVKVVIEVLKFL